LGATQNGARDLTRPIENLAKRKATGGRSHPSRGRRLSEKDGFSIEPVVGETSRRLSRTRGGAISAGIVTAGVANVADSAGKVTKSKILKVKKSPANRDYERRGVITRGALIETELGDAVVTSRPSDDGVVNAVLKGQK